MILVTSESTIESSVIETKSEISNINIDCYKILEKENFSIKNRDNIVEKFNNIYNKNHTFKYILNYFANNEKTQDIIINRLKNKESCENLLSFLYGISNKLNIINNCEKENIRENFLCFIEYCLLFADLFRNFTGDQIKLLNSMTEITYQLKNNKYNKFIIPEISCNSKKLRDQLDIIYSIMENTDSLNRQNSITIFELIFKCTELNKVPSLLDKLFTTISEKYELLKKYDDMKYLSEQIKKILVEFQLKFKD